MTLEGRQNLISLLRFEESLRQFAYKDIEGHLTIGYGHNLDANGLSKAACTFILNEDADYHLGYLPELNYFSKLTDNRKIALASMAFNLGKEGFLEFKKMHLALESGDYVRAAEEILDSKAAKSALQMRYKRIAEMIKNDELIIGDVHVST